ncbi:plasmid mobilization relaxosome protein MobC [Bifidobacterium aemilianum]|nr:plasmid mobilization relaxosome protein MobC [Bifidobacterium aemilianum]
MSMAHAAVELFRRDNGQSREPDEDMERLIGELTEIRTQIWRIGHNVNQIAHVANANGETDGQDQKTAAQAARLVEHLLDRQDRILAEFGEGR